MLSEAEIAGRVKSCCCWSALQPFQSMIVLKLMIVFPCVSAGDKQRVAMHMVSSETLFWETMEKLKALGASSILVLPIEKMME